MGDIRHQTFGTRAPARMNPSNELSHACRSASTPCPGENIGTSPSDRSGWTSMTKRSGSSTSLRSWDSTTLCSDQTIGASARHGMAATTPNQDGDGLCSCQERRTASIPEAERWGHTGATSGATNYQIAADNTGPTGLHRRSSRGGLHQAPQIPGGASYGAVSTGGSL